MRIILPTLFLLLTACTVELPLIPVTNYIPPTSALPEVNCRNKVGMSKVTFQDVREKNSWSSEKSYMYAEDGLIETLKKAGLYQQKSPVNVTVYLKSLKQSEEIGICCTTLPVAEAEYHVSNSSTGETRKYAFKTECPNESDTLSMSNISDLYACTLRKSYAAFVGELAKPAPDNPVCQ